MVLYIPWNFVSEYAGKLQRLFGTLHFEMMFWTTQVVQNMNLKWDIPTDEGRSHNVGGVSVFDDACGLSAYFGTFC